MSISVDTIFEKNFSLENDGYNKAEVDAFLNEICDYLEEQDVLNENRESDRSEMDKRDAEIIRLQQLLKQAQHESAEARAKLALAPKNEATQNAERATQLLVNAQKLYDSTINEANKLAESIKAKAKEESDKAISGLENKRDELKLEISNIKASFNDYQAKIREYLDKQKKHLDDSEDKFK